MKKVLYILTTTLFLTACQGQETNSTMGNADNTSFPVEKTEQEWKAQLSPEEYFVIRQKGTERPYTGEYNMHFDEGTYTCRGATPHSSLRIQNLIRTVVGHPSIRASLKAPYWRNWTKPTA